MRNIKEIEKYCNQNNIKFKILSDNIDENSTFDSLPSSIEQKIIIDLKDIEDSNISKQTLFDFIGEK